MFKDYTNDFDLETVQTAVRALGISALRGEEGSEAEKILLQLADSEDVVGMLFDI